VATLYVGLLSRHGQARPLPMLDALGRAARTQPHRLHLILADCWLHPPEEAIWRKQAAVLCPEVRLHLLDGREEGRTAGDLVHRGHLHSCREIAKDPAMATRRDDSCNSGSRTCRR
jgi:hypothetical protein